MEPSKFDLIDLMCGICVDSAVWGAAEEAAGAEGAWCAGCVRLGAAVLPYSVRLLPGALLLLPPQLQ